MNHQEAAKLIRKSGIDGPCHGDLASVKAIFEAEPQMVDALNAVDPAAIDETPQGAAAHTQSTKIISYLLRQGVKPDIFMAAAMGRADEVLAFLNGNPELVCALGAHRIPLIAHAGNRLTAEAMLRNGVPCDIVTAVNLGLAEHVADLLRSDQGLAKVRTKEGILLVQAACAHGHEEVVRALLQAGADDPEDAGKYFLLGGEVEYREWRGHYFHSSSLQGAVFNEVDLRRAAFQDVNLSGAVLLNVNLRNATIDFATIDGLRIWGIEVQPLLEAERKRRAGTTTN